MDIVYQYTKKRMDFGRQPMFCEVGPLMCDSIAANMAEHRAYILRNPVHQPTQHTPRYSEREINTIRAEYGKTGTNHAEGGWPRDVNILDPEQTQRYRRKVEKDDTYIHCVQSSAPDLEHYVMQNNAIDMFNIYYSEMEPLQSQEHLSCRTVNVYRDPMVFKRRVSSICWQPEGGHRFAVAYNDVNFNRAPLAQLESLIWDVENALSPEMVLTPPCALVDLQFNPRDPSVLAGALVDGRVCAWDRRAGPDVCRSCAPHVAHRDVVRNVIFINSKSGQEFFSGSSDGVIKWWDMRNMSEVTDEMILEVVKNSFDVPNMANANGVSTLEFEHTIPTRFMAGTENGLVLGGNRKGKTALEKLPIKFEAHVGPVWSLERNPGFLKNFLTVGDWTARVWSEDCRESAVLWSPPHRHKVTAGAWSPTRVSVLVLARGDGALGVWDLLRRQHAPVLAVQLCADPLLRLSMHEGGALLSCGSQNGNVYMVEMSHGLVQSEKNDKVLLTQVLERESKRERILEARLREIRLKLRQAEEGGGAGGAVGGAGGAVGGAGGSVLELDPTLGDRDLTDAATDYAQQVKKELLTMT